MKPRISVIALVILFASMGCASTPRPEADDLVSEVGVEARLIEAGDEAARKGDFISALELFRQAAMLEPSVDAFIRAGAAAERLGPGRLSEAVFAYERVLEIEPDHVDTLARLGQLHLQIGNIQRAKEYLVAVVRLDPPRWEAHNGLGVIAQHEGNPMLAQAHYLDALTANPRSAVVLNNLGHARLRGGDMDAAALNFQEAIAHDPTYQPAWQNLGRVYAARKRYSDGLAVLLNVMAAPAAYNEVGYIAFRQGDLEAAELFLRQAVEQSPVYFEAAHRNLDEVVRALEARRGRTAQR